MKTQGQAQYSLPITGLHDSPEPSQAEGKGQDDDISTIDKYVDNILRKPAEGVIITSTLNLEIQPLEMSPMPPVQQKVAHCCLTAGWSSQSRWGTCRRGFHEQGNMFCEA